MNLTHQSLKVNCDKIQTSCLYLTYPTTPLLNDDIISGRTILALLLKNAATRTKLYINSFHLLHHVT